MRHCMLSNLFTVLIYQYKLKSLVFYCQMLIFCGESALKTGQLGNTVSGGKQPAVWCVGGGRHFGLALAPARHRLHIGNIRWSLVYHFVTKAIFIFVCTKMKYVFTVLAGKASANVDSAVDWFVACGRRYTVHTYYKYYVSVRNYIRILFLPSILYVVHRHVRIM
jgi:hypothetical protein